jgi:hypothetical protein
MSTTVTGWRKRTIMEMAREAWAEAGEGWVADAWFDDRAKAFEAFAALVRADEREACARVAEEWLGTTKDRELHIAKAIRARGDKHD